MRVPAVGIAGATLPAAMDVELEARADQHFASALSLADIGFAEEAGKSSGRGVTVDPQERGLQLSRILGGHGSAWRWRSAAGRRRGEGGVASGGVAVVDLAAGEGEGRRRAPGGEWGLVEVGWVGGVFARGFKVATSEDPVTATVLPSRSSAAVQSLLVQIYGGTRFQIQLFIHPQMILPLFFFLT